MMDAKYLAEIKARCELGRPAQQREVKALLAEVERQNQQIATLKKALILMGNDLADWMGNGTGEFWAKDYTAQAQGQEGKK